MIVGGEHLRNDLADILGRDAFEDRLEITGDVDLCLKVVREGLCPVGVLAEILIVFLEVELLALCKFFLGRTVLGEVCDYLADTGVEIFIPLRI